MLQIYDMIFHNILVQKMSNLLGAIFSKFNHSQMIVTRYIIICCPWAKMSINNYTKLWFVGRTLAPLPSYEPNYRKT